VKSVWEKATMPCHGSVELRAVRRELGLEIVEDAPRRAVGIGVYVGDRTVAVPLNSAVNRGTGAEPMRTLARNRLHDHPASAPVTIAARAAGAPQTDAPRSRGIDVPDDAHAFWLRAPGRGEIRPVALPEPGRDDVVVRTLRSGVSRGTETLVFRGGVPPSQHAAMRAPFQEGEFPGPVKYGYLSVGAVEQGPAELRGRTVFCLYPHQTAYVVPAGAVTVVPDEVPPARAVLAGTVETAVNALWDAPPLVGDRVAVVGAGMVGCCVARLLARFPGVAVTLVDVDPSRADVAAALGAGFARPEDAAGGRDLVVHASATSAGLQCSLDLLAPEGTVLDLSWYGDAEVRLSLGGAFHTGRLGLRASQVGRVSPARSARRTTSDRLALALELLRDPAFDVLVTGESRFDELPGVMARLAEGSLPALCHTIAYERT
jgi:threonine dehydrogenase-like Zn-dependent dehydrogenase